ELGLPVAIGSARAEGWQHFPIVRMVNVSLDPGDVRYTELLGGVESGLLLDAPASYSLDDKRQNFHFSTQSARVIRNGALEGYVRGVSFQSLTPDFWGRCDAVADDWELHGFLSCAKGEPLQLMRVGHGAGLISDVVLDVLLYQPGGYGVFVDGPRSPHFWSIAARIALRVMLWSRIAITSRVIPVQMSQPKLMVSRRTLPSGYASRT